MPDRVALSPADFADAFPFHIAFDQSLRIVQAGRTMLRLDATMAAGSALSAHLRILRPEIGLDFASLTERPDTLYLIEHLRTGLRLRGQIMPLENDRAVFIGSPWLTDPQELDHFGLVFKDFAIHDPVVDLLQLMQAQKSAFVDQQRLAEKLTRQRAELREANQQLSTQNDALARATVQLRAQEIETRKLALVAARTDNAVVITDPRGLVEWVNEGFTRMTGYTLQEMRGRSPGSVLQCDESDPETVRQMKERIAREEGFSYEIVNRAKNGELYWVAIEVQPMHDERGRLVNFMALETNITERKEAAQRISLQLEVNRSLFQAVRTRDALPLIESACRVLGLQYGALWETRTGRCLHCWTVPELRDGATVQATREWRYELPKVPHGALIEQGEVFWFSEVRDSPLLRRQAMLEDGLRKFFGIPIQLDGETVAVAEFAGRLPQQPDRETLQILRGIGQQLSVFAARMRDRRNLRKVTDELAGVFSLSSEAYVAFYGDAHAIANPALGELTGVSPDTVAQATEAQFDALMAERCSAETPWLPLHQAQDSGVQVIRLVRPRHAVLARAVRAMKSPEGETVGRIVYLRDITRETEVDRMKSEFLSTAAHELRTPMASIHGFSELLLAREFDPETRRDLIETIHRQSSLLVNLVNDLLDLARIEARGGKDFRPRVQPLLPILREATQSLMVPGDPRKVSLEPPEHAPQAEVDAERLTQAIVNVLSNAYKYSPGGGSIRARIVEKDDAEGNTWAGIAIADKGIGMSPEQTERLFEGFYRADPSGSIPGTGLGMSLVKEIMELMGGHVEVRSALGRGTEITLWMPARASAPAARRAPKTAKTRAGARAPRAARP